MNKKILITLLLVLSLILVSTSCTLIKPAAKLTPEQKQEDLFFLYDLLESEYPFLGVKTRIYDIEWLANKDKTLKEVLDTESDKDFYYELYYLINDLHDRHTQIVSPEYYELLKRSVEQYESSKPSLFTEFIAKPHDSAQDSYKYWRRALHVNANRTVNSIQEIDDSKYISFEKFHEGETAYIRFSAFTASQEGCQSVYDFIKENINCSNMIIDIRSNGGGSEYQWLNYIVYPLMNEEYSIHKRWAFRGGDYSNNYVDMLIESNKDIVSKISIDELPAGFNYPPELAKDFKYYLDINYEEKSPEPLGYTGDIYVLTNRGVYSSAEAFAAFCKQTGFATLVGERTLGDGGATAPILVKLPNSGLLLRMRLQMILNPDGTANAEFGTAPDIEVPAQEALEEVLKIIEENRSK